MPEKEQHFDFAVAGSSPLAALLAGALRDVHGARVTRVGRFLHPLRPQRGFDIGLGPSTRPETWRLLQRCVPETLKLLDGMGGSKVYERVDPLMVARTEAGAKALQHMRVTAAAYGTIGERLPISPDFADRYRFRDVTRVMRRILNQTLAEWLAALGVPSLSPDRTAIRVQKNGPVRLRTEFGEMFADTLILAGEGAISRYGDARDLPVQFETANMSAVMFEPAPPLSSSLLMAIDNGLTIYQRKSGALDCVGRGTPEQVAREAAMHIREGTRLRLAGAATYAAHFTRDGGPLVGRMRADGALVVAGLGPTGLFQVPALARYLAGVADAEEVAYFNARNPVRAGAVRTVADYRPEALSVEAT